MKRRTEQKSFQMLNRGEGVLPGLPEYELIPAQTAFLTVDLQYLNAHPDYGMGARAKSSEMTHKYAYYFQRVAELVPIVRGLQDLCRRQGIEVMHTRLVALTEDCRDANPALRRAGLIAAKGSMEARILSDVGPQGDEIVFDKTSSSLFNSTAADYVLRNLGITTLIVAGVVTPGCVQATVVDAADRGYAVLVAADGCAAPTRDEHEFALSYMNERFAKVRSSQEIAQLIGKKLTAHASRRAHG